MTLLTEAVKACIGQKAVYTAPEEIGRAAIRYFALAIGDDNPLYTDPSYARANGYEDVIAPPTFVCESNQYMSGERNEHGYAGHTWDIPAEGCRMLRGGNEYELHAPMYPWFRITATWLLKDIVERTMKDGTPMLIVTSEASYTNQDGLLLAVNRETLIYRSLP